MNIPFTSLMFFRGKYAGNQLAVFLNAEHEGSDAEK
jgi:hypothetical protein